MPKKEEPQKGNRKKTLRRYVERKVHGKQLLMKNISIKKMKHRVEEI